MTLSDKRIVILGGTSGIGLAVAAAARAEHAEVTVVSSQKNRVETALEHLGPGVEGYTADVSDEVAASGLFAKLNQFDHLVYTAGDSVWQRSIKETQLEDARRFFDVRFWGAFLATKYAAPQIRLDGSITLTSSTVPRRPSVGFAIGASVSSAIESFALAMAVELAPIRVNVVAPGIVRTPIWNRIPEEQRESMFRTRGASFPVGRVGEPSDVAEAYLSFMRSDYTTGQVIVVDGGMLLV